MEQIYNNDSKINNRKNIIKFTIEFIKKKQKENCV